RCRLSSLVARSGSWRCPPAALVHRGTSGIATPAIWKGDAVGGSPTIRYDDRPTPAAAVAAWHVRPPRSASMIHVRNLTKSYDDLRRGKFMALRGISFDARAGEVFGLLGPNGAGKTTAMRILSTVLRPTSGTALVNGYDVVTQPSQVRHQIGFVSANTGVYDRMTAWEMVGYFGRLYGLQEDALRDRMEDIFERLKMNDIRDRLGAKMSTGMKQKVSIARAIVHDPPVLIFDEATSGLDVLVARALLDIVAELREEGKCIVFSTHIMREAERLCDRLAIMHEGKILAEGTVDALLAEHGSQDLEDVFFALIRQQEPVRFGDGHVAP